MKGDLFNIDSFHFDTVLIVGGVVAFLICGVFLFDLYQTEGTMDRVRESRLQQGLLAMSLMGFGGAFVAIAVGILMMVARNAKETNKPPIGAFCQYCGHLRHKEACMPPGK